MVYHSEKFGSNVLYYALCCMTLLCMALFWVRPSLVSGYTLRRDPACVNLITYHTFEMFLSIIDSGLCKSWIVVAYRETLTTKQEPTAAEEQNCFIYFAHSSAIAVKPTEFPVSQLFVRDHFNRLSLRHRCVTHYYNHVDSSQKVAICKVSGLFTLIFFSTKPWIA